MDDDALNRHVLETSRSLFGVKDPAACDHRILVVTKFSLDRGIEEFTCRDCETSGAHISDFRPGCLS